MLHYKGSLQERLIVGLEALNNTVCSISALCTLLYKQNVEDGETINSLMFVECCKR